MSREFPSDKIIEAVATPGDSFMVLSDSDVYKKEDVQIVVDEIKEAHELFIKKVSRLTKKYNINVDIKTIVIADEYS